MLESPTTASLLPEEEAARLGVLADSLDRYDLMRAIERCAELISQLQATQLIHSQNLCRVANHLACDRPEAGALDAIAAELDRTEWETERVMAVVGIVRDSGRRVRDIDGNED